MHEHYACCMATSAAQVNGPTGAVCSPVAIPDFRKGTESCIAREYGEQVYSGETWQAGFASEEILSPPGWPARQEPVYFRWIEDEHEGNERNMTGKLQGRRCGESDLQQRNAILYEGRVFHSA